MLADRLEIFFLADGLGGHARLAFMCLHAVAHHVLQRRSALMLHHVQRMGELAIFHRRTGLQHILQRRKQLFCAFHRLGGPVELDPAVARRGLDAQLGFQLLQIARFVVE
jgi:hypothetical protein